MLVIAEQIFDNVISGTTTTWYSPAMFNEPLGAADFLALHATWNGVQGTSPGIAIQVQHSGDNLFWLPIGSPQIQVSIFNDGVGAGSVSSTVLLNFVRIAVTLSGTNPQCRLKVYATGKDYGHRTGPGSLASAPILTRPRPTL